MNYDELKDYAYLNVGSKAVEKLDSAIDSLNDEDLGEAIYVFVGGSGDYTQDAIYTRELIEYIDGLKDNQDNGDES